MITNYLKVALRNIWKHKLVSTINTLGLAIGIASAGLAYLYIQHELSYDRMHDRDGLIYYFTTSINNAVNTPGTPAPLPLALEEILPGVTSAMRLEEREIFIQAGMEVFKENALVADSNFFSFFDLKPEESTPSPLSHLNNIVLTRAMSKRYFGREEARGEVLQVILDGERIPFKVTGIINDPESNSSLDYQFVIPMALLYKDRANEMDDWGSLPCSGFIRLRNQEDLAAVELQLKEFELTRYDSSQGAVFDFQIHRFKDYHLGHGMQLNALKAPVNPKYLVIFGLIALIVLVMACFNFMNLSNALGSQRMTEIGVRQVLGAGRQQLIRQFLTESLTLSLLSMIISLILIDFALKFLPALLDVHLEVNLFSVESALPMILIVLLTGLMAGLYPSLLLSGLKPTSIFKPGNQFGGSNTVTRGSLLFQFTISTGLLAAAIIMFQQQQFLRHQSLGFDQEKVIVIANQVNLQDRQDSDRRHEVYSKMVRSLSGIDQVSGVSNSFARGNRAQFIQGENGEYEIVYEYRIEPTYLELLNIPLVQGRNFLKDSEEDREKSIIVNEEFLRHYEIKNPIGYILPEKFESMAGSRIIGVTHDFHFGSLKSEIYPLMLHMRTNVPFQHLLVKVNAENVGNTLQELKKSWREVNPDKPFEFYFLDEDIQRQYAGEERWSKVTRAATGMAMIITFCGLFGLISLSLTRRRKEISIRKILGSSVSELVLLFARDFMSLLIISSSIAIPIVWYIMVGWLRNFAYGVTIQWWVFLISASAMILIIVLNLVYHGIRASEVDPVESLRNE